MKKYKLAKNSSIGSPDAETDDLLMDAFIHIGNLEEIIDTKNQKSILLGRTGTGKSAIIKYIKKNFDDVREIAPEAMSLRFLSNSTILRYFNSIGVHLNLFYKVLWKHVFIVELLRMYFKDELANEKKNSFFHNLRNRLSVNAKKDPRKEKAIKYMETWTNDFWEQTEMRVKSIEENIHSKFVAAMGLKWDIVDANLTSDRLYEEKYVQEARQKAEAIIHTAQAIELIDIIEILKNDLFNNPQKKYFIVVDDLDREWIEDTVRYQLIGAMMDVIKEFRQFSGVKIVISLRENLNEIVSLNLSHIGSQREKLKPLFSDLLWTREELKELIDKRLEILSQSEMMVAESFYQTRRNNISGFDYVLDRTFYRPRDVISFVNAIIQNANNKTVFTKDIIYKAEPGYSLERFQALEDEWCENFGKLSSFCGFLKGIHNGFKLRTLNENQFADIFLEEIPESDFKGEILQAVVDWKGYRINFIAFSKKIIYILYRIGIIGIKKGPTYKTGFYFDKDVLIDKTDVSNNCKFYVHPSLYSYFKVNVIDQLPEEA